METQSALAPAKGVAPVGPMLWQQVKAEFLKLARNPAFSISSLALPTVLFGFFALRNINGKVDGINAGQHALAAFGAYGVMSVMLYSFGVSIAVERGQRVHLLIRATPLRPLVALAARAITALAFALMMLLVLCAFAILVGGIQIDAATLLNLVGRLLLGSLPFIALGFAIGYLVSPTGAAPIINLCFLVLSFVSGLFIPLAALPDFVQKLALYLPTYRLAELAWNAVGVQTNDLGAAIRWLVIFTVGFTILALRVYTRSEQRTFG